MLETINLCKVYPNGTAANKNVNFSVKAGEIHGLVGENGAGKSTLMKIIYGEESPSAGILKIGDKEVSFASSRDAIAAGIGMVHQHFMLVSSLSLAENLVLGNEPRKRGSGFFDLDEAVRITEKLADTYNLKIMARARVVDVSVSMRQKLEILKALYRGARILVLDEPTAVLTPQETEELFVELKALRDRGQTIVFISHKLGEVFQLCDRVTVMRDGKIMGTHSIADVSRQSIANEMVGREVKQTQRTGTKAAGEPILVARDLAYVDDFGITMLDKVSFALRSGEILGVVGVDGNGQSELVKILTGATKALSGSVRMRGKELTRENPRTIRQAGLAHVAEDRMTIGTALGASIEENLLADRYSDPEYTTPLGFLKKDRMARTAREVVRDFDIRCSSPKQSVASLSGGNMQKVVIGREFTARAEVLIVSQPTRGVDIGAIEFIHKRILSMRDEGRAVLLVSSDLTEVMALSDSLIVMHAGKIVAYFPDSSATTDRELGLYMLGLAGQDQSEIGKVLHGQ